MSAFNAQLDNEIVDGPISSFVSKGDRDSVEESRAIASLTLGAKYRIGHLLGRGGTGSVYEVETSDGQVAAAKILRPADADRIAIERFLREAMATRSIDSPHVTRVLDVGFDDALGCHFIVLERLRGIDLARLYNERAPLAPIPLTRLFVQAALGISAAHERGVAHRDIKPANLFLDVGGGSLVTVKVCDFGLAKSLRRDQNPGDLTRSGSVIGSPHYMSPEQAIDPALADQRSDLWSLGIAFYEGLTGQRLWRHCASLGEIIIAICTDRVPPLRSVAPWVVPGLASIIDRALEPDPWRRWASMDDMIAALLPFTNGTLEVRLDELATVPQRDRKDVVPVANAPAVRNGRGRLLVRIACLVAIASLALGIAECNRRSDHRAGSVKEMAPSSLP